MLVTFARDRAACQLGTVERALDASALALALPKLPRTWGGSITPGHISPYPLSTHLPLRAVPEVRSLMLRMAAHIVDGWLVTARVLLV